MAPCESESSPSLSGTRSPSPALSPRALPAAAGFGWLAGLFSTPAVRRGEYPTACWFRVFAHAGGTRAVAGDLPASPSPRRRAARAGCRLVVRRAACAAYPDLASSSASNSNSSSALIFMALTCRSSLSVLHRLLKLEASRLSWGASSPPSHGLPSLQHLFLHQLQLRLQTAGSIHSPTLGFFFLLLPPPCLTRPVSPCQLFSVSSWHRKTAKFAL